MKKTSKKSAKKVAAPKITVTEPVVIDFGVLEQPEQINGSGMYLVHLTPETTSHILYDLTGVLAVKNKGHHTYLLKIRTELSAGDLIKTISAMSGVVSVKTHQ